ncbi:AsnC family protein [Salmonella enterica subsp. enterica]|nr:AsnC family protein [Salmonella enterica subsp. enterica serovar Bareilly]EEA7747205.1 AsnC family protein [Salmonella enterica subsp. enterica serovar Bareilly]ELP2190202.1 AsnC family protein [Salmonella enterica subsp. enterica serovar Bareilly]
MILKPLGTPGKCPAHCRLWTPEEDELLISLRGKKTVAEIAALLPEPGRTVDAAKERIQILRERYPDKVDYIRHPYTTEEDDFIRKNCHTLTIKEVAAHFDNRSQKSVKERAKKIGVSFRKFGGRHQCAKYPDEIVFLVEEWRDDINLTFREIDRRLNLPRSTAWHLYYRRTTADYAIAREYLPR